MPSDDAVERAAAILQLLSDPTRIKLLWAMSQGESSVTCLAELSGASPAAVSQHLAKLRLAGVVTARRDGTFRHYAVVDAHVTRVLRDAVDHAGHDDASVAPAVAALDRGVRKRNSARRRRRTAART